MTALQTADCGYRSEFIRCECCVMFAETLLLLISLHFSALLGLTSVRSSFLIDVHYHEGVFRQIPLISSSSVGWA